MVRGIVYLSESGGPVFLNWILSFFLIAAFAFLITGFLTPIVVLVTLAGGVLSIVYSQTPITVEMYGIVLAATTMLLGPGAYSLDARLFGRREIIIPKGARSE